MKHTQQILNEATRLLDFSEAMTNTHRIILFCIILLSCFSQVATKPTITRFSSFIFGRIRCGDQSQGGDKQDIHEIVKENVLYSRWRTLASRVVRFPDGREVDFDVSA